jgi:hypothetical protein
MSKGKLQKMIQKNLMIENRYLIKKNILLEYDEKVVDAKKNEIISTLESLKSAQKGMLAGIKKSEIDKQIKEVQSINTKNVCNGTNLNQEISSALTKAENTLNQYDSQLDDCPEGCKSKLRTNITFIKEFCSKEETQPKNTTQTPDKEDPAPTGDQYYKSQQTSGVQRMTQSQPSNVQNNTPSKIPDSERRPRFMDELERLNTDPKFSKQDIIDYVKSKVVIKTT